MKTILMFGAATVLASTLTGCVVVPAEPVVYAAPPPPRAVIVRPAYRHHYYGHGGYGRRHWHR
ncbi:MAG TPA: hypothetical protein VGX52_15220 [Burkholderiales bacterium]|nr:hypothetical protein [Burkholderiales bacterium]